MRRNNPRNTAAEQAREGGDGRNAARDCSKIASLYA